MTYQQEAPSRFGAPLTASEARATGRHAVADQFTERAAELIDRIVSQELAGSSDKGDE
jgi:hypothetical protein